MLVTNSIKSYKLTFQIDILIMRTCHHQVERTNHWSPNLSFVRF